MKAKQRNGLSLRTRLVLLTMVLFAIVAIVSLGIIRSSMEKYLYTKRYNEISILNETIANQMMSQGYYPAANNASRNEQLSYMLSNILSQLVYCYSIIIDHTGMGTTNEYSPFRGNDRRVFLADRTNNSLTVKHVGESFTLYFDANDISIRPITIDGEHYHYGVSPFHYQGMTLYIISFYQNLADDAFSENMQKAFLFSAVVGTGIMLLFTSIFVSSALQPLTTLAQNAKEIDLSRGESHLGTPKTTDEVGALAETLNTMLERVNSAYNRQKQFTQDASHELRIPLTIILGNIDLIKKYKDAPEIVEECLQHIDAESTNMKHLVERLLSIARLENNTLRVEKSEIDLFQLLSELSESTHLYSGRDIYVICNTDIYIHTDKDLLLQCLRSLLDNAIKYSPEGSAITIQASEKKISVVDQGAGIPKNELENIRLRFYRSDSSRNSKTGGAGLGLNIAETIASVLGANLEIESEVGVGTKASITFK